jgi:hypothetical protein
MEFGEARISRVRQQAPTATGPDVEFRAGQNPVDRYREGVRDGEIGAAMVRAAVMSDATTAHPGENTPEEISVTVRDWSESLRCPEKQRAAPPVRVRPVA